MGAPSRRSTMWDHSDVRKVDKGCDVGSHDAAAECLRGGSNDQVVRTSWAALGADMSEQDSVRRCYVEVIVEDRDARHDVVDIRRACRPRPASCK